MRVTENVTESFGEDAHSDLSRLAILPNLQDTTLPSLTSALSLYKSLGFKEIAAYRNNPDPDAVFMQLGLVTDGARR
jgi:hypothetical protein